MNPDDPNPEPLVHCPLCSRDLPVSAFGICRARKSGRNLYDKECIRKKVTESRRALKEYKAARKNYLKRMEIAKYFNEPLPMIQSAGPVKLAPVDRVRDAIQKGHQTQREIARETKLGKDEIGDALTQLLLWNHEIRTELKGETRIYFFPDEEPKIEVKRKQVVLSGFSGIQAIMPERKRA